MEVVVTTGAINRAKLQSNHHHQQTNTQFFTGRMPFLSPNQQCQSTEGKTVIILFLAFLLLYVSTLQNLFKMSSCVASITCCWSPCQTSVSRCFGLSRETAAQILQLTLLTSGLLGGHSSASMKFGVFQQQNSNLMSSMYRCWVLLKNGGIPGIPTKLQEEVVGTELLFNDIHLFLPQVQNSYWIFFPTKSV